MRRRERQFRISTLTREKSRHLAAGVSVSQTIRPRYYRSMVHRSSIQLVGITGSAEGPLGCCRLTIRDTATACARLDRRVEHAVAA